MRSRRIVKAFVLLLLLIAVAMAVLWRMTWAAPPWYRPAAADDRATAVLAEAVENRIIEEAYKVRPADDTWTLRIRSEQINAWLATRLRRWLIHERNLHWPEQLGTPQVQLTREGIDIALQLSPELRPRVFVIRVVLSIVDDRLYLHFDRLSLGRVPLSHYTLNDLIELAAEYGAEEALQQPESEWLLALLNGKESVEPVGTLTDGRRVRLLAFRLGEGFIDLSVQTLAPQREGAGNASSDR